MDMHNGSDAGVSIDRAGGNDDMCFVIFQYWQIGTTDPAEGTKVARGRFEALNQLFPRKPAEAPGIGMQEAAKGGTVQLATHGAMAVIDELGAAKELVLNLSTKAGTANHCFYQG